VLSINIVNGWQLLIRTSRVEIWRRCPGLFCVSSSNLLVSRKNTEAHDESDRIVYGYITMERECNDRRRANVRNSHHPDDEIPASFNSEIWFDINHEKCRQFKPLHFVTFLTTLSPFMRLELLYLFQDISSAHLLLSFWSNRGWLTVVCCCPRAQVPFRLVDLELIFLVVFEEKTPCA
jgi:hypothetical protein